MQTEILILIASIILSLGLSLNLVGYYQDTKKGKKHYQSIKEKLWSCKQKIVAKNLSKCNACKAYNKAIALDKMSNVVPINNPIEQSCPYRLSCTQKNHRA